MKNKEFHIHNASGIIIVERKLLVARKKGKEYFVSPGGQIEKGESPKDTLIRELLEELDIVVSIQNLKKFGIFYAEAAYDPGKCLRMDLFRVHSWKGDLLPSGIGEEMIEEILWLNSQIPDGVKVGSIFEHEVIPRLKKLDLID